MLQMFYLLKPIIPRPLQIYLRQKRAQKIYGQTREKWPINAAAANPPENWKGWPDGKRFALVLIHDVDTLVGHQNSRRLMEFEKKLGFRSAFNFVPERYQVDLSLLSEITENGFEVGVHGLKHDGRLFLNKKIFEERSIRINRYLRDWGSVGFSSPSMHHRLEWMHLLNIRYGISTFDTDPFEPQPDGIKRIFPCFFETEAPDKIHLEMPYTLAQDFTLFVILGEKDISIWERKLNWIAENGGMALLNTHPDYMNFSNGRSSLGQYSVDHYLTFLELVKKRYYGQYWQVLPRELAEFWRNTIECNFIFSSA